MAGSCRLASELDVDIRMLQLSPCARARGSGGPSGAGKGFSIRIANPIGRGGPEQSRVESFGPDEEDKAWVNE